MLTLDRTVLSFFVACVLSISPDAFAFAKETSPIRVACLGDSITAGARVEPQTESYPARLQGLLGDDFDVRNFGIGGATLIKTGRPNIWRNLDAVKRFEPHIAIISLGTNDTVGGNRKNWEQIERFDDDYSELIKTLAELPSMPRIVLCTPTAMVLKTPGLSKQRLANLTERKPRLRELCERIRKLAEKHADQNVSLLELNAVLQDRPELLSEGDGVHPNVEGYLAIAQAVADHIGPQQKPPNVVGIGPSNAIRLGDWKLIYYHQAQQCELFNLAEDLGEQNNLAEKQTEVRDRLASALGEYLASVKAQMPIANDSGESVPYPGLAVRAGKDR
jgi:sialate O-acetylesterase